MSLTQVKREGVAMRRLLSLLSLGLVLVVLSGCCCHHSCSTCGCGGCGLGNGNGHYLGTHGVCDCDLLNPCYSRAPWAMMGGMMPGDIPMTQGEEIKVAPKVDKK
jgi:hypothetical protein